MKRTVILIYRGRCLEKQPQKHFSTTIMLSGTKKRGASRGSVPPTFYWGGGLVMYLSPHNLRNSGMLKSATSDQLTQCHGWPVTILARSNFIYAFTCHSMETGSGRGQWCSGAACPKFWGSVDSAPKPSTWTEKLLLFIFLFHFYGWKGQRVKNKWAKIGEKTRFGVP